MKPITAKDIQTSLYWSLRTASQLLIPRFTPAQWWECDLWRLTNADFVDEYEIKLSVCGPNRFWFVMPIEVADKVTIPEYAGLLVFHGHCHPFVSKQAPKRHNRKWDGNKLRLFETFYHRYWNHEGKMPGDIPPSQEPIEGIDDHETPTPQSPASRH